MNTTICNPLLKILLCLRRMTAAGCPFPACLQIMFGWTCESIAERNRAAEQALAIDDPLERVQALLELALRNDPPRVRNRILAAVREVHSRTEAEAAALRIQIPLALADSAPAEKH